MPEKGSSWCPSSWVIQHPAPMAVRAAEQSRSRHWVVSTPSPAPRPRLVGEVGAALSQPCRGQTGGRGQAWEGGLRRGAPTRSRTLGTARAGVWPAGALPPAPAQRYLETWKAALEGQDPQPEAAPARLSGEGPGPPAQHNPDGGPTAQWFPFAGKFLQSPGQPRLWYPAGQRPGLPRPQVAEPLPGQEQWASTLTGHPWRQGDDLPRTSPSHHQCSRGLGSRTFPQGGVLGTAQTCSSPPEFHIPASCIAVGDPDRPPHLGPAQLSSAQLSLDQQSKARPGSAQPSPLQFSPAQISPTPSSPVQLHSAPSRSDPDPLS